MQIPESPGLLRLAVATGLASIGLAAGGTGGALLATKLAGTQAVAGLPFGLVVAGSAGGAVLLSWLTVRIGRSRSLAVGYLSGVIGCLIVVGASIIGSLPLVLVGSLLLGPANASVFLARYAGADLAAEVERGRAIGTVLFAAALGAVLAPNLLGPSGALATALGLEPFSGLYLVGLASFGVGMAILATDAAPVARRPALPSLAVRRRLPPATGLVVLGAANASMVGLMAVAPVHLANHGHSLEFIGLVISVHVVGMLMPSPVTGWLSDRIGPGPVAAAGGGLLAAAGIWGAVGDQADWWSANGYLATLGLGWNLAVVSGSAMLTAGLSRAQRPRAEAAGEVVMGLAAALGAGAAGILAAAGGWPALSLAAALVGGLALIGIMHRAASGAAATESAQATARDT